MFIGQGIQLKKQKAVVPFGNLFQDDFANLNNWTSIGGGSFTPDGTTGLTIGAGITDYLRWIEYDPLINTIEDFLIFFQVEVLAVGIMACSVQTRRLVAGAHKKTFIGSFIGGATTGRMVVATYADGTSTVVSNVADGASSSPASINYAVGHFLNISFRRNNINDYTAAVQNVNNGDTNGIQYSQIPDASPSVVAANNACKFAIHCVSGSYRIVPGTFVVSSNGERNLRALFVGDSRTTFMSASPASNRYANITFVGSKYRFSVNAGAYDTAGQYSIQGPHINSYGADFVFLGGLMRNGVFYGIAQATNRANYTSIRDNAVAGGAKVVHILFPNDTSATMTTENAWVVSTFTSDIVLDFGGNTYSYADGVHFSNTGHASIGADIRAAMPWLY